MFEVVSERLDYGAKRVLIDSTRAATVDDYGTYGFSWTECYLMTVGAWALAFRVEYAAFESDDKFFLSRPKGEWANRFAGFGMTNNRDRKGGPSLLPSDEAELHSLRELAIEARLVLMAHEHPDYYTRFVFVDEGRDFTLADFGY